MDNQNYFPWNTTRANTMTWTWWRHQMETFSTLLAICGGNSVTRSFDVLFDLRLNKRLNKQLLGGWFGMPSHSLWHHCNDTQGTWHQQPWHRSTSPATFHLNAETAGNAWVCTQHCDYWCPGAKAPGHQYPQCWINIHCIGPILKRYITLIRSNIGKWNYILKKKMMQLFKG